ncbi:hypothetical protein K1T71_010185 [Dendrolimus kikuchii]|uniref:Uncharacterized protein n=1 Tax=Dendrolimus kikuchii TaxID=765133 RepID=A0ACC1CRK4_9NEOP|nr:hypothetical protein K1T71_010185 [Dendrolimus kikuchii]
MTPTVHVGQVKPRALGYLVACCTSLRMSGTPRHLLFILNKPIKANHTSSFHEVKCALSDLNKIDSMPLHRPVISNSSVNGRFACLEQVFNDKRAVTMALKVD